MKIQTSTEVKKALRLILGAEVSNYLVKNIRNNRKNNPYCVLDVVFDSNVISILRGKAFEVLYLSVPSSLLPFHILVNLYLGRQQMVHPCGRETWREFQASGLNLAQPRRESTRWNTNLCLCIFQTKVFSKLMQNK